MEGSRAYRASHHWTRVRTDFFPAREQVPRAEGFGGTKALGYVWARRCESDMSGRLFLTPTTFQIRSGILYTLDFSFFIPTPLTWSYSPHLRYRG